jgi:membrane-associated protease RseP (regulator of RpoE activity)
LRNLDAKVADLAAKIPDHPYHFFLGDELLGQVALDVDFGNQRLAFLAPASVAKPAGAQQVPLVHIGTGLSVPVAIEQEGMGLFHIELANSAPLMVTRPYAQSHELSTGRPVSQRYTGQGKEPEGMTTVGRVTFAGVEFANMPTVIVPESLFDPGWFDSDHLSGVVGTPLLSRFHVIFDPTHDLLYAVPNSTSARQTPFYKDRLGMTFKRAQDGNLAVAFIAPGSPAQTAGFKLGDEIAELNGESIGAIKSLGTTLLALATQPDVAFKLTSGEIRTVKPAEFY